METLETPQPQPRADRPLDGTNWTKIVLAAVLGLGLLAGSACAGYWYGTESSKFKFQSSKLPSGTQIQETPTSKPTTTPTPDPTANWKTYTSNKMGFSIKIPENYSSNLDIISLDTPSQIDLLIATFNEDSQTSPNFQKGEKQKMAIQIQSWDGFPEPLDMTFDKWRDQEINFLNGPTSLLTKDNYIIDKIPSLKVIFITGNPISTTRQMIVYAQKADKMFRISAEIDISRELEGLQLFDQILSTFKFLD